MPEKLLEALLDELRGVVGEEHVVTDTDAQQGYVTDWTGRFHGSTPAVVRPGSTAEVAAIVDVCRRQRIAIVPQGGNTGLVGGGVPLAGEVVVSLRRMSSIGAVDVAARQVTAQAGATLAAVRAAAAAAGLAYPIDLGARDSATIGGTIATNAGGLNLLRYGGTRQHVVGIEAVLGNGTTISALGGLIKDNTGYHLPSLLCGSEGTLGIVTAARLALVPRYDQRVTALLAFGDVDAAVRAVAALRNEIDSLEAAELFLDAGLRLVCDAFDLRPPFAEPHAFYVLVEAADRVDPTAALADAVQRLAGVADVAVADGDARRHALWRYREEHTLAINTVGAPHKLDITVPVEQLAGFVRDIPGVIATRRPQARTWMFGHVGDGNLHVNITGLDPDDEAADEVVFGHVVGLGGSISAEHGIGTAKKQWLHLNRSAAEIDAMRAIKHALDPDGVMNPNALLP
ncbi:MAG: FAD-binding oxidoreductase [Ilumatobacteraceae bacterium]|nr:FAD-binding oxidoreductase [Ilumatobacteraceae bacterium]